jgi:hypothetical protein
VSVSGPEIRKAKRFLTKRARKARISPRKFAAAAKEMKSGLDDVLGLIRYYYSSGDERAELRRTQLLGSK